MSALLTTTQIKSIIKTAIETGKSNAVTAGDPPGLTLTVSSKGTATWVLRYKISSKSRELTLARYPDLSLSDARALAREHRVAIAQGRDPAAEKTQAKIARADAILLKDLAAGYLKRVENRLAHNTMKQYESVIRLHIIPKLGNLAAIDLDGDHVVPLLEKVAKSNGTSTASIVRTTLSLICDYGIARRAIKANPCVGIKLSAIVDIPAKRQRLMLNESELRALLTTMQTSRMTLQVQTVVKILLGSAVRLNELLTARWEDVDLEGMIWTIPTSKTSDRPFRIPLTPWLADQFKIAKTIQVKPSEYVFPGAKPRQPTMHSTTPKIAIDALSEGQDQWRRFTPHDLRSTARSWFSALGANVVVAERALNHKLGGLLSVYDQHDYFDERRALLLRWCEFLECCATGKPWQDENSNVIKLKRVAQ